jgi:hypothetical protein
MLRPLAPGLDPTDPVFFSTAVVLQVDAKMASVSLSFRFRGIQEAPPTCARPHHGSRWCWLNYLASRPAAWEGEGRPAAADLGRRGRGSRSPEAASPRTARSPAGVCASKGGRLPPPQTVRPPDVEQGPAAKEISTARPCGAEGGQHRGGPPALRGPPTPRPPLLLELAVASLHKLAVVPAPRW